MNHKSSAVMFATGLVVAIFGFVYFAGLAQAEAVDTTALFEAIRRVEEEPPVLGAVAGSGPCQYPADALADVQAAKEAAQTVLDNRDSTQEEVDVATASLNTAVTTFSSRRNASNDISVLLPLRVSAQAKYDAVVSEEAKYYPQTKITALKRAIYVGTYAYNYECKSVTEINTAASDLEDAIADFDASRLNAAAVTPVITLTGGATANVSYGATYTDAGATGSFANGVYGTVVVTRTGTVSTTVLGDHTLTFTASNGVNTVTTTRVVTVVDLVKPVITLSGSSRVEITQGSSYTDAGATVTDNTGESITATSTGSVNINSPGTYTITYSATDASNNVADSVSRTVVVTARSSGGGGGGGGSYTYVAPVTVTPAVTTPSSPAVVSVPPVSDTKVLSVKISRLEELVLALKPGVTSREVRELQTELKRAGFMSGKIKTTEYFGPATKAAVGKYLADKESRRMVAELLKKTEYGTKNANNKKLQTELKKLGYFPASLTVTEYYGPTTKRAVDKYLLAK